MIPNQQTQTAMTNVKGLGLFDLLKLRAHHLQTASGWLLLNSGFLLSSCETSWPRYLASLAFLPDGPSPPGNWKSQLVLSCRPKAYAPFKAIRLLYRKKNCFRDLQRDWLPPTCQWPSRLRLLSCGLTSNPPAPTLIFESRSSADLSPQLPAERQELDSYSYSNQSCQCLLSQALS